MSDQQINEMVKVLKKTLKTELKHLPIPIPVLIVYSDHPERVERPIQLFTFQEAWEQEGGVFPPAHGAD